MKGTKRVSCIVPFTYCVVGVVVQRSGTDFLFLWGVMVILIFVFHSNQVMKTAGPESKIFGIDVECVATGIKANARTVARIVLVNWENETVFDEFVKPDVEVFRFVLASQLDCW